VRGIVCWLVSLSGPLAERRGFVWLAASVARVARGAAVNEVWLGWQVTDGRQPFPPAGRPDSGRGYLPGRPAAGRPAPAVARRDHRPRHHGLDGAQRTRTYALHLLEIGLQAIQLSSYRAGPAAAHLRRLRDVRCFTDMLLFPFPFRSR
jgi:hypothetical protein